MDFDSAMREVLNQTKYDKLAGRVFDWRQWLKERAMEILRHILDGIDIDLRSLFRPGSADWTKSWIGVLHAAGIILLILIAARLIFYAVKRVKRRNAKSKGVFEGIDKERSTAAGLLEESAWLASGGYLRDAVRYCLAASLLALDRKRIHRLDYTKTNRQIIRELRDKAPSFVPGLTLVVDVFNAVWFGRRGMTNSQFDDYWRETSMLLAEVDAYKKE
ncbi:MAG: DUF4129 domain-containing protein [Clostridiales bacterium]|jgi:hypothetical protein|nr:DUF4129 domain-containing protein [Clostridiales bacterium]